MEAAEKNCDGGERQVHTRCPLIELHMRVVAVILTIVHCIMCILYIIWAWLDSTCCNIENCMLCNVYWICCTSIELDMTVSTVILTHRIDSVQCSLYQYDHLSNENCYYGSSECQKIRWRKYLREPARHVQFPSEWLLLVRKTNERQYLPIQVHKFYIAVDWQQKALENFADDCRRPSALLPVTVSLAWKLGWWSTVVPCYPGVLYSAVVQCTKMYAPENALVQHGASCCQRCTKVCYACEA